MASHTSEDSQPARALGRLVAIESRELRASLLGMVFFFLLFSSYSIVKPVRDAMGTVYGMERIQELFLVTFVSSLLLAVVYSSVTARIRLANFLPWVYGAVALSLAAFAAWFARRTSSDRMVAAAFYVWLSTINMLVLSVFWTYMADIFSRTQARRIFGFIAAGGTAGSIVGPSLALMLSARIGTAGLLLISAAGFALAAVFVRLLASEKRRMAEAGADVQPGSLEQRLSGHPFDGFRLLLGSRYLLLVAAFLFLMTWVSTIVYLQLGTSISKGFASSEARTQAYALIELLVNLCALFLQLLGTGRFIARFGVTAALLLNPLVMVLAFLAVVLSPALWLLGGVQIIRRVAEYAVAKPAREMLFTVVDRDSRYKAKNVIDTVVYRLGDLCAAWTSAPILKSGIAALGVFGALVSVAWFPVARALGRRYESLRS